MPHHVIAEDYYVNFMEKNNAAHQDASNFFFELERPEEEKSEEPVVKRGGKPPRPPLRSIVSKAFIKVCKDKPPPIRRARSFSFLRDSPDTRSLLSDDENSVPFDFDDGSEFTSDLGSESSFYTKSSFHTAPYTMPMEHRRLKKQLKLWKSRMSRSLKNLGSKRNYKTMTDELFGGIEVPLNSHQELMLCWNTAAPSKSLFEARDDMATKSHQAQANGDLCSSSNYPNKVLDFATHSPSRSTPSTKGLYGTDDSPGSAKDPAMTVSYENDCAQLVFAEENPSDERTLEIPFDEEDRTDSYTTSSSPSDEETSISDAEISSQVASPVFSPGKPLGVSFSHPSWLKRQNPSRKEDYGEHWETLGDPTMDGDVLCHGPPPAQFNKESSTPRILPTSQKRGPIPYPTRASSRFSKPVDELPFDEAVADSVVRRDRYGNVLGVEIVPRFDKVLRMPFSGEKPRLAPKLKIKNRPVCSCVKCSASSIYADLYPSGSGK